LSTKQTITSINHIDFTDTLYR